MIVKSAFARLDIVALSVAAGTVLGLCLFVATAWLLVKGAPPGVHVGPHLGLLAHYLPGYSVSWFGSVLVVVYGFLMGIVAAVVFGVIWNVAHYLYLMKLGGLRQRSILDV